MASQMTHLPHIQNIASGVNKWDPVNTAVFEVYITLPNLLQQSFNTAGAETISKNGTSFDILLSEQVTTISGLDALQKVPAIIEQKFQGVTVSALSPVLDSTAADITVEFNLNLRNVTDNFVLRVFKEWARIGYDILSGARTLKNAYSGGAITVAQANRDGCIWRAFSFKDIIITGITGLDSLDYTATDSPKLTVTFRSDYWTEIMGNGTGANDKSDVHGGVWAQAPYYAKDGNVDTNNLANVTPWDTVTAKDNHLNMSNN